MNNKKIIIVVIVILLLLGGIIAFIYSGTSNNDSLTNNSSISKNSSSNDTNLTGTVNNTKQNKTNNTNISSTDDKSVSDGKKVHKQKTYLTEKKALKIAKEFGVDSLSKLGKKAYYENGFWKIPIYDKETGKKIGYTTVSDKTGEVVGSVTQNN